MITSCKLCLHLYTVEVLAYQGIPNGTCDSVGEPDFGGNLSVNYMAALVSEAVVPDDVNHLDDCLVARRC